MILKQILSYNHEADSKVSDFNYEHIPEIERNENVDSLELFLFHIAMDYWTVHCLCELCVDFDNN